jgi:hypothetical protein
MATFKQLSSLAQSGGQPSYLPRPLANMSAVLNPFWDEYAHRREAGIDPDEAVDQSLTALLPSDQVDEVLAMLRGELDQRLSILNPFNGREVKADLIEAGDKTWHKFQASPGWSD